MDRWRKEETRSPIRAIYHILSDIELTEWEMRRVKYTWFLLRLSRLIILFYFGSGMQNMQINRFLKTQRQSFDECFIICCLWTRKTHNSMVDGRAGPMRFLFPFGPEKNIIKIDRRHINNQNTIRFSNQINPIDWWSKVWGLEIRAFGAQNDSERNMIQPKQAICVSAVRSFRWHEINDRFTFKALLTRIYVIIMEISICLLVIWKK